MDKVQQRNVLGVGLLYLFRAPFLVPFWQKITWLILPVVICLSQRLSHACLSFETANGSLKQL